MFFNVTTRLTFFFLMVSTLETKGHLSEEDRRKMRAVKAANPDLDVRFVFQTPYNKIYKGSKTTYAKWAEKHGFLWCAFHSIPIEWLT
jgi:hypothetical protein